MWEWIQTWTFFNWLAVIAFCMATVGFLNSFLGLKSRWKDWRATRGQVAFNNRLEQLKNRFELIKKYRESPVVILEILDEFSGVMITFLGAIGMFSVSVYFYFAFSENSYWAKMIAGFTFLIAQILVSLSSTFLSKTMLFVRQVVRPIKLAEEIIKLINDGKAKNLIIEEESTLINSLIESGLFTEYGKKSLLEYVDNFKLLEEKKS